MTQKVPGKIKIGDKEYSLLLLRVVDRDAQGRPSKVIVGYDDTTFDLRDPTATNEFITAYVSSEGVAGKTIN